MSSRDPFAQSMHPLVYLPSKYLTNTNSSQINHDQFCYHPSQLANFMIHASKSEVKLYRKDKLLKWIAYATFCQPVLVQYAQLAVQALVSNQSIFQLLKNSYNHYCTQQKLILMEAINIFCQVKGFSLEIFQIKDTPLRQDDSMYTKALWINILPYLSKNNLYKQCQMILKEVPKQTICQVRNFIGEVYELKQIVVKNLVNNNYYLDIYKNKVYKNIDCKQEGISLLVDIHQIDIQLSKYNCLVSAQYLPEDYKGQYIQIWINRTVQLNSLLGNFVCKQRFGEFQYVKGPLTYAMQKGIMLILNNFQHISNQLLVGMRTLAQQMKIFHNQKNIQAKGGFKILGLCSTQKMSTKMKNMILNNQYIQHLELPKRSILNQVPRIQNEVNIKFLIQKLTAVQNKLGLIAAKKLWKRIIRARKILVQSDSNQKLWQTFFTQSFKDSIELQISDLSSVIDPTRTIHFQSKYNKIIIGRTSVNTVKQPGNQIVKTQYSLSILQKLAICSQLKQTPLLISETGCGKTTLVQYLAQIQGHHLYVYNMSSGTDVMDLVGGFKPIDCRTLLKQLFYKFIEMFRTVPGSQKNQQYLQDLMKLYNQNQLKRLLPSLSASIVKIKTKVQGSKQKKQWNQLKKKIDNINANLSKIDSNLVFSFIQGNLIKAMKNGDWVLIDEINMATNDILQKIVPLIQGKSLLLYEKGDLSYIQRHQDFKIIACMNPANDSGKKPLPANLMQKFTVINLMEPQRMDIQMMVKEITPQLNPSQIADIYFILKKQKTISLRNLSRCLSYLNRNKDVYTFKRALYDALLLGFQSKDLLKKFIDQTPPKQMNGFIQLHGFLIEKGNHIHQGQPQIFHLTQTFLQHLKDFLRAIAGTQLPVLLQGPTSAGKTSIIRYVAFVSGHKCIRINNHQHTQIEQYLGNYYPDKQGKLIFRQGPLVQAVRQGHWLILDQLNLARTQILQCLNRLLDDNRELFIPQQQIHIKPHKNFRIFATQNPASYSGRKTLSRAFRNRFISLSFDDITIQDTMAIMKVRRPILNDSKQLSNYVKKTLQSLQNYRQKQRVFSKDSIITIRDLLKWTGRKFSDKQSFMRQGYALLTQRLRTNEQKKFVQNILFAGSKNQNYNMFDQYQRVVMEHLSPQIISKSNIYVQMNKSFKRMAALTLKAVINNQAVLLVGETGCGKTTLAELLASISGRKFYSINCHKHTQASDLLGCLRPCVKPNSLNKFQFVNGVVIDAMLDGAVLLIDQINTAEDSVLERLNQVLQSNNIGVERGQGWETINAKPGFCIIATMNPSGDYGKKELSPALRNRFTEIWVEPITHPQYIEQAQSDITQMIIHKLSKPNNPQICNNSSQIAKLIFNFIKEYNCNLASKYGLTRKMLTMRDIGWVCKFMTECQAQMLTNWRTKYYWALRILAIEGLNFIMGDLADNTKLHSMKQELTYYINNQSGLQVHQIPQKTQIQSINILKQLTFPLLIKTDLPLQLLGVKADERIFFSPHTELSDLLGQFRPKGTQFIWKDETLLNAVKKGQRLALIDLNLAQQPVIEGINSLFDHRGSIFVVQLNQMFVKNQNFRPIVVLKQTTGSDRRGLPNSFLNRFIKIRVKDVPKQTKITYLKQKYVQIVSENPIQSKRLWSYVQRVLVTNPKTKIQNLEYICSLYKSGFAYMKKGIQMLSLPPIQQKSSQRMTMSAQQRVLQLLPITDKNKGLSDQKQLQQINQKQLEKVKMTINSYTTLSRTNFSLCLIGSVKDREILVKRLGYLLNKNIVKVILSTMTDMADLLGSYQQVDDQQEQQYEQTMQQQITSQTALNKILHFIEIQNKKYKQLENDVHSWQKQGKTSQLNNTGKPATNFRYIKSRIMKTLQDGETNLLYIEVPSQVMLERVEKGIRQLYEQKVNIIVGIDTNNNISTIQDNTKFIPILLNSNTATPANQFKLQKQCSQLTSSKSRVQYFKPNHTNLIYSDKQIRKQETQGWIKIRCGEQSNRNMVKAWQRLYQNIHNQLYLSEQSAHVTDYQLSKNKKMQEIFKQICTQVMFQRESNQSLVDHDCGDHHYYTDMIKQLLNMPSNKEGYQQLHQILQLLNYQYDGFHTYAEQNVQNKNNKNEDDQMKIWNEQDLLKNNQREVSIGFKFKYLYMTDISGIGSFRQQAKRLLEICYRSICVSSSTNSSMAKNLLKQLVQQVQPLYTNSMGQTPNLLIPYNEHQHKLIPILPKNCLKSLNHYILSRMPYSVTKLLGLEIDFGMLSKWQVQRSVIGYMSYLGVDVGQLGGWLWGISVRDLPVYNIMRHQLLNGNIDYWTQATNFIKDKVCTNAQIWKYVKDILVLDKNNNKERTMQEYSSLQLAYKIFNCFKPNKANPYLNLYPHIQTQSQLKCLEALIQQDKYYLEVYRRLCDIKYSGYQANSYKIVEDKISLYNSEYEQIKAKRYIYRGYDNIKLLKHFYEQLTNLCEEIQQSQFNIDVVKNTLNQLYKNYYHDFKDILWPIFVSLITIHSHKILDGYKSPKKIITQKLLKSSNKKSFQKAIELILHKQEQQFHDAAKNYTKFQRKFKNTVIVDEYTNEGVKKNKENQEEQFREFFGKADSAKTDNILDQLYMMVRKRAGCKYELSLIKQMFTRMTQIYQFIINLQLKFSNSIASQQKIDSRLDINIYQQYSLGIVHKLSQPLPKILLQTKTLLSKYNIDSVKVLGTLCNKIQQHKAHQQVYKILIDCEFLITKIYEINSILPIAQRIETQPLENICLNVRRIQLKNWKSLLDLKINRVQKADTLEFIHFYRNFTQIGSIGQTESIQVRQCFKMCDDFMRQSKISCYQYRLYLLSLVSQNTQPCKTHIKHTINRIINFYSSLRQSIMQYWQEIKKQRIKQVVEYEKLAKWDSNRYMIFRQGCQKFQKKIHHILKRYQQQLSMQVGVFHTNSRSKKICQSIQQFSRIHKMKQQSEREFSLAQNIQQNVKQNISNYEGVIQRIFQCLEQIKQQQHNTQSKMLLIRNSLSQLEQLAQSLPSIRSNNVQSQVLVEQMFPQDKPQLYRKAQKYYFEIWDKLSQKTQTAWNREIVERVWAVTQKIWITINCKIPTYNIEIQAEIGEQTDNMLIIFEKFISKINQQNEKEHHPIFIQQVKKIKSYLLEQQNQYLASLNKKYKKIQNPQQLVCLMKIGYIVSSIALNLQKNGLCVKENQQQGEQSGTEEVGDGVGIGQGQAHEGAENVGDQIQFQEQVQGHKDQQKNNDANANKKQENDIQMEGDFEGDMYSKQKQQQDEQNQGQSKSADQKMGSVDNEEKQQDMKNDEGRAQGSESADVQIDGQEQGSQQLVDNEQQSKQARKGQNRDNQDNEEQGQQEKSDWDDNNEQGQKINKQKQGQMEQQIDNQGNDDSGQSISGSQKQREQSNSQNQNEWQNQDQQSANQQNQNSSLNQKQEDEQGLDEGKKQGEMIDQVNQQAQQDNQQDKDKQKKFKKTKKTKMQAFGRSDLNSNNPLKNNQNQLNNQQKNNNEGVAEAQGAKQGQKGVGDPVHSLSAQLLKQIQSLQRVTAKQNSNFMKDLNVVAHDSDNDEIEQDNKNKQQQQYQLTQQQNKNSTNLPAFLDSDKQKIQQQQKKQEQVQKQQRNEEKQVKKQKQEKSAQFKNKSKIQKSKNVQDKQQLKQQQIQQMVDEKEQNKRNLNSKSKDPKDKIIKQQNILQINYQQYLKSIVDGNKSLVQTKRQAINNQCQQWKNQILSQAFEISKILQQKLKSVLQPMDNAQYRGDYKTGKKLNLKKIIPFIASNYRKDKIWLRRTQPSQRNYFIMIALDDTKSMKHGEVGIQALKGLLAISLALQHLSIKTCITGIRDSMNIYKNFQGLLQPTKILQSFDFSHQSKVSHDLSIASFMQASLQQFKKSQTCQTGIQNKQLCFIISDGKMNKDYVRPYMRQAKKRDIIYVFIIVDSQKASILTTKSVSIGEDGKVKMKLYMSDFPFQYFLIVRNVRELGDVLATTLLQFIQEK